MITKERMADLFQHLSFVELHNRLQAYEEMTPEDCQRMGEDYEQRRELAIEVLKQMIVERQAHYDQLLATRMVIHCPEYLAAARTTADKLGRAARASLEQTFAYVATRWDSDARCHLYAGGASNHPEYKADFSWCWMREEKPLMGGGIVLHIINGEAQWSSHS